MKASGKKMMGTKKQQKPDFISIELTPARKKLFNNGWSLVINHGFLRLHMSWTTKMLKKRPRQLAEEVTVVEHEDDMCPEMICEKYGL